MESDKFSLCWNNFNSNMRNGFNTLLTEEHLVDVTLAAEGKFLKAHKAVLSVCSPYFNALFKANPCKHPIVILQNVSFAHLNILLQFMYKGEVSISQDEIPMFMRVAEMLKVKGLTENSSDECSKTNGVTENSLHKDRGSPYSDPRQEKFKTYSTKPMKKVVKHIPRILNVENIKTKQVPSLKALPVAETSPTPPPTTLCEKDDEPTTDSDTIPFLNPKQEPIDPETDDEYNNDFDDGNLDMSSMLDTTLSEPPHSGDWLPDESKFNDISSPGTLQCILGKRGNPRLIVDGHVFYKKSTYKGKSFWYCKLSRTPHKCQAVCWTLNGSIVKWPYNHSHVVKPEPFNPEEDIDVPIERLHEVLLQSAFTSEVKFS